MVKIAPSILAADLMDMKNEIELVDTNGADYIHIDVMDGHYVNNIAFGPNVVKSLRAHTKKILDVHLMISPVQKFLDEFISVGADIISFHPDADQNSEDIIKKIKSANRKVGIAIHPKVSINEIIRFIDAIDIVIVMTVVPGFGGQKFMHSEINKINELANIRKEKSFAELIYRTQNQCFNASHSRMFLIIHPYTRTGTDVVIPISFWNYMKTACSSTIKGSKYPIHFTDFRVYSPVLLDPIGH